ncbi:uncharacterized protein LOC129949662 [Eupeodes corollae]|uniref:uncharacterized protein LOC129949662 n=1 Tax=Eupeodes corollae TaxID=290404 RepID=UPI0024900A4F|nr:uncharacterized protein LOC129949662 [Eupeodes corollae]XP_055917227.1 uncharacterized protein LOC129949662 [Eupeodes corollae]XP_055917228.1 uncharacterized protein LOC129949662 [Eupeodes corollae]
MEKIKTQMYPSQKYILLLLLVLRYPIDKESQEFTKIQSHILDDYKNCPKCFENQSDFCKRVHLDYHFDENLTNNLNILFGVRQNRVLSNNKNSSNKIFAKYLARDFDFSDLNEEVNENEMIRKLSQRFLNESRLDGMQFCPHSEIQRFIQLFAKNYTELNIWMHMNINVQPILLPHLHSLGFPVPETYATCGFTIYQSFDGVPLADLYSSDFITKLKIASNLLKGAFKFSEGFNGFRIYITDLNMDNVVYNQNENKVSFVDLDTVLIVDDHHQKSESKLIHKHEFLECNDCFAFSPTDICASGQSDINIFAVCQLLRENLTRDRTKGFLYPVPEKYNHLESMLSECVDCKEITCKNRYDIALEMISRMEEIIIKNAS